MLAALSASVRVLSVSSLSLARPDTVHTSRVTLSPPRAGASSLNIGLYCTLVVFVMVVFVVVVFVVVVFNVVVFVVVVFVVAVFVVVVIVMVVFSVAVFVMVVFVVVILVVFTVTHLFVCQFHNQ